MTTIHSRASWGARHRDGVGNRPVSRLEKYLHHSVTRQLPVSASIEEERVQIRTVEGIGQQRFGAGMSYTFLVPPSGRIYEGVSVGRISYHSGPGRNTRGVGICLVGNTDANEMTAEQVVAVAWLLIEGVRRGWWTDPAITEGHRDFKQTACPGQHAYSRIGEINRLARSGEVYQVKSSTIATQERPTMRLIQSADKGQVAITDGVTKRYINDPKTIGDLKKIAGEVIVIGQYTYDRIPNALIEIPAGITPTDVATAVREALASVEVDVDEDAVADSVVNKLAGRLEVDVTVKGA